MKLGSRLEMARLSHPGDNFPGREDRMAGPPCGNGMPPFALRMLQCIGDFRGIITYLR